MKWKKGHQSFLFTPDLPSQLAKKRASLTTSSPSLPTASPSKTANVIPKNPLKVYSIDHVKKTFFSLSEQKGENGEQDDSRKAAKKLEEEIHIDEMMSRPITSMESPGEMQFVRSRQGQFAVFLCYFPTIFLPSSFFSIPISFPCLGVWGWSRRDKTETINEYDCRVFTVQNIQLLIQKRFEHLSKLVHFSFFVCISLQLSQFLSHLAFSVYIFFHFFIFFLCFMFR
jgi:hypothetical protein